MVDGIFSQSSTLGELRAVVPHETGYISCGSRGFIFKNKRGEQFAMSYDKLNNYLTNISKVKDINDQLKNI